MKILLLYLLYAIALSFALARAGVSVSKSLVARATSKACHARVDRGATGGTGRQLIAQALERGYVVEWVIVRPGALTDGDKRGVYRHGHDLGSFIRTVRISRADVADFMLNQIEGDTYL